MPDPDAPTEQPELASRTDRPRAGRLVVAGLAVAATVVLMLGALSAWQYYEEWRLGRIMLTTDGHALVGQVLAGATDTPVGEAFSIGPYSPLTLPAGDYRLRVRAKGFMGQTYRIAVNRGETMTHHLTLDENRLLGGESIPFSPVTETVMLRPGKTDFIEWNGATLIRRDGSTGKPIWDAARPARPWSPERDPVAALRRLSHFGDEKRPGELVQPAPDLDGDGTGDLIWAVHGTPSLLALSGKDGSVLWAYSADPGSSATPLSAQESPHPGRVASVPAAVDVDGDGITDLVAEFVILDDPQGLVTPPVVWPGGGVPAEKTFAARRVIAAVSGRSGKEVWRDLIDQKPTNLTHESFNHGITYVSQPKQPFVAVVDGTKWIGLDPATGRARGSAIDLGFTPVPPIQHVDLDGDGTVELLVLEAKKGGEPLTAPTLAAFSTATGRRLWVRELWTVYRPMPAPPVRDWPLAADFGGDGRVEIVIPQFDVSVPRMRPMYGGVRMLDGVTGEPRWDCPLYPGNQYAYDSLIHLLGAPDLDTDGTRDLIVVSRFSGRHVGEAIAGQAPEPSRIYVDAISGKNGQKLWHWRTDLDHGDTTPVGTPFWWGRGPDGWPMLALPIGGGEAPGRFARNPNFIPDPPVVHLLAASTGREAHAIDGLGRPGTADLDGDGLADLWGALGGKVRAFRAFAPEAWRALGGFQPAGDLDGDGVTDVVSNDLQVRESPRDPKPDHRTAIARSGRDGRILWQALLDTWESRFSWGEWKDSYRITPLKLPAGDLDGDGAPDIVVHRSTYGPRHNNEQRTLIRLQALSGRTGDALWSAAALPDVAASAGIPGVTGIDAAACPGWGRSDVFVLHHHFVWGGSTPPRTFARQSRLARLSGRDGRVIWDVPVADYKGGILRVSDYFVHQFADLDGDGSLEMVLLLNAKAAGGTAPFELRVLSLATGDTRWSHPLNPGAGGSPTCVVGDLDGDKRPEVVVSEQPIELGLPLTDVTALDGVSGKPRWVWRGSAGRDVTYQNVALALADFDGHGRREVCVSYGVAAESRRVEILDPKGRSRAARDTESVNLPELIPVDLDGDGRDELLFRNAGRLCAVRGDLTDIWSWPTREPIREVLPASPRHAATVILNPSLGLDGATGRPAWSIDIARSFLNSDDGKSPPRVLAGPDGAPVCRMPMPITAEGTYLPAQGLTARPAASRDDPRRERPLPWVSPIEPYADPLEQVTVAATLVNVCIPVAIIWLATRKRFWSVRLLLALPVVAAILLTSYSTLSALILDRPRLTVPGRGGVILSIVLLVMAGVPIVAYATAFVLSLVRVRWLKWLLALPVVVAILVVVFSALHLLIPAGPRSAEPPWWEIPLAVSLLSMSGLPIVAYAAVLVLSVVRRRWRKAGLLIAGALLAAVLILAITFQSDMQAKPLIEHYDWSGWHQVGYLGAYMVGAIVLLARPARGVARFVWRLARPRRAVISTSS